MIKEKKAFWLILKVSGLLVFLFWSFAYFRTEAKPIFAPLYATLDFKNSWLLLPLVFLNYGLLIQSLNKKRPNFFQVFLLGFVLVITINFLKSGSTFYDSLKDGNNYYQDSLKIEDLKKFLSGFDSHIYYYNLHTRTHPPGPVILHYFLNKIGLNQIIFSSLMMILLSMAVLFPISKIAIIFKNPYKFLILLLFSSPGFLIYSATCMDTVFATLVSLAFYFILRLRKKVSAVNVVLAAITAFLALFFSYAAVIIPFFSLFLIILSKFKSKKFILSQLAVYPVVGLIYLFLFFITGFKPIASFFSSRTFNSMLMPDIFMTFKRYIYSVGANFVEYIIFLGLPIFALFLLNLILLVKKRKTTINFSFYLAFLTPMVLLNFLGVYKTGPWSGETGRIWFFLTPLIISGIKIKNENLLKIASFLSFFQTVIMQLLLNFFW